MLEEVKKLLELTGTSDQDEKLASIIDRATKRLKVKLGSVQEVPPELDYIVIEVAIIRFNRIGSEGTNSHSVEGESTSYGNDDFAAFNADIQDWINAQETVTKGKVRFL